MLEYKKELASPQSIGDEERGQDGQSHSGCGGITNGFSIVHGQTWPNQDGTLFTARPFSLKKPTFTDGYVGISDACMTFWFVQGAGKACVPGVTGATSQDACALRELLCYLTSILSPS